MSDVRYFASEVVQVMNDAGRSYHDTISACVLAICIAGKEWQKTIDEEELHEYDVGEFIDELAKQLPRMFREKSEVINDG